MDYIKDLRQKIGHSPLIIAGATVLIINDQKELLLLLRNDNKCWGVPGGAMELAESLEDTAVREVFEETGLQVKLLTLFNVFSGPELYYQYPNGDLVYNVSIVYTTIYSGKEIILNPNEHSEWGFFPLKNLPSNISPPIIPILEKYKTTLKE